MSADCPSHGRISFRSDRVTARSCCLPIRLNGGGTGSKNLRGCLRRLLVLDRVERSPMQRNTSMKLSGNRSERSKSEIFPPIAVCGLFCAIQAVSETSLLRDYGQKGSDAFVFAPDQVPHSKA